MKKLTVFLTLLLCVSFAEMSAQSRDIRWELNCYGSLAIVVNGITQVSTSRDSSTIGLTYGVITVNEGDDVFVYASTQGMIHPIIVEDSPEMIEGARQPYVEYDYYWPEYGHDSCNEEFIMPDIDMYVGIEIS